VLHETSSSHVVLVVLGRTKAQVAETLGRLSTSSTIFLTSLSYLQLIGRQYRRYRIRHRLQKNDGMKFPCHRMETLTTGGIGTNGYYNLQIGRLIHICQWLLNYDIIILSQEPVSTLDYKFTCR
jgi:hypothetical protein